MKMPSMETVSRYVMACKRRKWRPVFTHEQFRAIFKAVNIEDRSEQEWLETTRLGHKRATVYGVEFTVNNNPRPPMPEEMLDRDSVIEEEVRLASSPTQMGYQPSTW